MDSKEAAAGGEEPVAASAPSPPATAAGAQPAPSAPGASATAATRRPVESGGGEDEQVERFYALLDNVRAMRRGMYRTGGGAASSERGKKRARGAPEPAWRPVFRMEDFAEAGGASKGTVTARRPGKEEAAGEHGDEVKRKGRGVAAAASPSPSPPRSRAG